MNGRNGFRVASVRGFDVRIDASWFILFFLILWSLSAGTFPATTPGLGAGMYLAMGLVGTLLFFGSLLLHEVAHSVVARAKGIEVHGITLFVFGGMAHTQEEPHSADDELVITSERNLRDFCKARGRTFESPKVPPAPALPDVPTAPSASARSEPVPSAVSQPRAVREARAATPAPTPTFEPAIRQAGVDAPPPVVHPINVDPAPTARRPAPALVLGLTGAALAAFVAGLFWLRTPSPERTTTVTPTPTPTAPPDSCSATPRTRASASSSLARPSTAGSSAFGRPAHSYWAPSGSAHEGGAP